MPTIGWVDVDCTEREGQVAYRDMMISIRRSEIDTWRDDPDGRFKLAVRADGEGRKIAEPVKFYPSL
ncbi:hypothetical protein [Mangrovibrevibacter kandeliae]|uniref:hypothetical protein n=1 Tax=Mangrovibrevibacter kandeliae TaxID=2968473 RepID=UPI0021198D6C|nr:MULTISPECIES: hypothetical protein [unclassified Aurantimonas]MCQ8784156.1 hypothetical protein [Aurantimonas sp. CSK15Z-1]MCW4116875.1 hypothetical protein [Aurantimonas sp. MSK8Z-1]